MSHETNRQWQAGYRTAKRFIERLGTPWCSGADEHHDDPSAWAQGFKEAVQEWEASEARSPEPLPTSRPGPYADWTFTVECPCRQETGICACFKPADQDDCVCHRPGACGYCAAVFPEDHHRRCPAAMTAGGELVFAMALLAHWRA